MGVHKYITVLFILFECISCKNRTGTPCNVDGVGGTCRRIDRCPFAMKLVNIQQKRPPICQYEGDVEIVCCPPEDLKEHFKGSNDGVIRSKDMTCRAETTDYIVCCQRKPDLPDPPEPKKCRPLPQPKLNTKVQHFAWQKCVDYQRYFNKCVSMHGHPNKYKRINTCGIPNKLMRERIHDGTPALPRQFPHMAVVGCHNAIPTDDVDVIWVGGGSLISEKYILTAAHVLVENTHGRIRYAMMGTLNITDTKLGIIYNVIRTINHKGYERRTNKLHDIGLLELNERVKFNEFIRPACLPVPGRELRTKRTIAGWGVTSERGKTSQILLTARVYEAKNKCKHKFRTIFNPDSMICARGDVGTRSSDSCNGDSGGPLMAQFKNLKCSYSIEGVVSYGPRCGQSVGVYTRVEHYLDWIIENVWPDEWRAFQEKNRNI